MFLCGSSQSYALSSDCTKEECNKSYYGNEIEKQSKILSVKYQKGAVFVLKIEDFIKKNNRDKEKLESTLLKVEKVVWKLINSDKHVFIKDVLEYLLLKIRYELSSENGEEKLIVGAQDIDFLKMDKEVFRKYVLWLSMKQLKNYSDQLSTIEERSILEKELQKYIEDTNDIIVETEVRTLGTILSIKISQWMDSKSDLFREVTRDLSSDGVEWYIWKPIFFDWDDTDKSQYADQHGYEYEIAYYKKGDIIKYQVLWFLWKDPSKLTAYMRGNYQHAAPENLFQDFENNKTYSILSREYPEETSIDKRDLYTSIMINYYFTHNLEAKQWLANQTANSTTSANVSWLFMRMWLERAKWAIIEKFIWNRINLSTKEWVTHYVGDINYELLGVERKNALDSFWNIIQVSYYKKQKKEYYQLLWFKKNWNNKKEALVMWVYLWWDYTELEWLFVTSWGKVLKNGDILGIDE